MLSQTQVQSQLNAMMLDLVQESRVNRRTAEARFGNFRVTAVCRMNGVRLQLYEEDRLLDTAWDPGRG